MYNLFIKPGYRADQKVLFPLPDAPFNDCVGFVSILIQKAKSDELCFFFFFLNNVSTNKLKQHTRLGIEWQFIKYTFHIF